MIQGTEHWEECQGYIVRRVYGIGDITVVICGMTRGLTFISTVFNGTHLSILKIKGHCQHMQDGHSSLSTQHINNRQLDATDMEL